MPAQHSPSAPPTGPDAPTTVLALSGNPRPGSRTLAAAQTVARRVADAIGASGTSTVDLATFAGEIFAPLHPHTDAAREQVAAADVVVVATPVYKASYTGLLKAFLDQYGPDGLAGVVTVPLVVSGDPAHALAGEVHLRPVLVELGAVVPTRTLSVPEARLVDLDPVVDEWLARSADALRRAVDVGAFAGLAR
ncbi:NAD(P)H-dependent oxidoreductase [Cellulosimicrobium terreum]|nr:NAD(P)H-dependent oxidoreductase [Cellulosimicrobium terreum]